MGALSSAAAPSLSDQLFVAPPSELCCRPMSAASVPPIQPAVYTPALSAIDMHTRVPPLWLLCRHPSRLPSFPAGAPTGPTADTLCVAGGFSPPPVFLLLGRLA
eukprot:c41398_g1_i1 orf=1-309(-)